MQRLAARYDPSEVSASVRAFWAERSMPSSPGSCGPASGTTLRQFFGAISGAEAPLDLLARAVVADARARYDALCGLRSVGIWVVRDRAPEDLVEARRSQLDRIGAWTSSAVPARLHTADSAARIQEMVEVLAVSGLLVRRDLPFRNCATCHVPRSPEGIIYQGGKGPAYLVRFVLRDRSPTTSLIVWTDALWKLLGTSAVLVDPDQTYAVARYQRRGIDERIIIARSAIPRLREWLPSSELEVIEERPGWDLPGTAYLHPLATEFPPATELAPPCGTVLASPDVGDSGTGLVTLAPKHGAGDAAAASALHVGGSNVLDPDGRISREVRHKYAGLPIDVADSFILRDLTDAGLIFAELVVRRGVPYCAVCGTALVWAPGNAWCLDISRLPPAALDEYSRLLPGEPPPAFSDVIPWPMTFTDVSADPTDPQLGECDRCDRLTPGSAPGKCRCGGTTTPARRRILTAPLEAFQAWTSAARGEAAHLFVPDRRRSPMLVHHLLAREAARLRFGDLGMARLPTFPPADDPTVERLLKSSDSLRAALVWASASHGRTATLVGRWQQEERRLRKFWELARRVLDGMLQEGITNFPEPISTRTSELSEEDRAFLARFERLRLEVRGSYDARDLSGAQERLLRFMEEDLRNGYVPLVRPRLERAAAPASRFWAFRLLSQVVTQWAELYAPIAPYAMEEVVRAFRGDQASLFERGLTPITEGVLDPERESEFDQWVGFAAALGAARRQVGLGAHALLPKVVLIVPDDASAEKLLRSRAILARLGQVQEIEIDAPNSPWSGRRVDCRPIASEIQRIHGSRAARIIRLLEHIPARKVLEGVRAGTLTLTIEGGSVAILPSMVQFAESLPECVVPVPWRDTEILVVDPRGSAETAIPALSLDGFRIVRHVKRRLARTPKGVRIDSVVVAASGDLAAELGHHGLSIARHLGVLHWEVTADPDQLEEPERSSGRTRRGEPWWVWIPGLRAPPHRLKQRPVRTASPRVRISPAPENGAAELLDESHAARSSGVAEVVDELARELGRPYIGPAKAEEAWDAGFHSVADYASAPFDRLSPIPGFGPVVAAEIVRHFGGTPPPLAVRRPPRPSWARVESSLPPLPPSPSPEPVRSIIGEPRLGEAAPAVTRSEAAGPISGSPDGPSLPPPTEGRTPGEVGGPRVGPPGVVPLERPGGPTGPVPRPATAPRLEYLPKDMPPAGPQAVPLGSATAALTQPPSATLPPVEPPPLPAPPPPPPPPEGVELWPGPEEQPAWKEFLEAIAAGRRALCVTRLSPELRSRSIDRPDVELLWLSNTKGAQVPTIRPGDIAQVTERLRAAIADRNVEAVFVDGVEYLALIHGVDQLVSMLTALDVLARARHARVFVPMNPALMAEAEFTRISEAFHHGTPSTTAGG